jgi:hypothetical protein
VFYELATGARGEAMKSATSTGEMSHHRILLVLASLMSRRFSAALNQTIVSTAVWAIADGLDGLALQGWATSAY